MAADLSRYLAIATLIASAAIVCCSPKSNSSSSTTPTNVTLTADQRAHIRLVAIASTPYHKSINADGVVDFDNDQATSVIAPFSGPVAKLLVQPGDHVTKGEPLALVDSPDFATAISTYKKAIFTARTLRRLANIDKDLFAHQGVAQKEEDQAQTDAVSAESDEAAARQALLGLNIDEHTIKDVERGKPVGHIMGFLRSPIAGTVVERLVTQGELLQAGTTPCFTIANLSRVWVMAQVFGGDASSVGVGDSAKIDTGDGVKDITGKVQNVATEVDPNTLATAVRVAVDNPGNRLKKQMYVHVTIEDHQQSTGILVPVSSVLRDDENLPFVYVRQPDGTFARAHVTLGYRAGEQYNIPDGLRPGEQVVADGALFLQFMQDQ